MEHDRGEGSEGVDGPFEADALAWQHMRDGRPGHDRRYAIDSTKIETELGWRRQFDFETALKATVDWYLQNRAWWECIRSGEYQKYYAAMYGNR